MGFYDERTRVINLEFSFDANLCRYCIDVPVMSILRGGQGQFSSHTLDKASKAKVHLEAYYKVFAVLIDIPQRISPVSVKINAFPHHMRVTNTMSAVSRDHSAQN